MTHRNMSERSYHGATSRSLAYVVQGYVTTYIVKRRISITGAHTPPSYLSARVIECFWLFFTTTIAASYCGNLIAFLTVHVDKLPFRSVDGLVGQDQYKWGITGGTAGVAQLKVIDQGLN